MKLSSLYSRLPAAIIFLFFVSVSSCKKDNAPPPDPPKLDTLGTGWQKIQVPEVTNAALLDIFFVNSNVGWVCGSGVFKSIDGGVTWNKQNLPDSGFGNMFFIDEQLGWLVGSSGIQRTKNGGSNWEKITITGAGQVYDLQFLSHRMGYLMGSNGLFRSSDTGTTWTKVPSSFAPNGAFFFLDSARGWAFNNSVKPGYTANGGFDFTVSNSYSGAGQYAVQFVDSATGWVAGFDGVLRTTDAGATWTRVIQGNSSDIHFFNKNDGYICNNNEVYRTNNGGQTLTRVAKIGEAQGFVELHFTDMNHGWVANYDRFILRYVQ
jgi:photosystem II stability/assembly factor-like uncharacterized protein